MKASSLINHLVDFIQLHGDKEVVVKDNRYMWFFTKEEVKYDPNYSPTVFLIDIREYRKDIQEDTPDFPNFGQI